MSVINVTDRDRMLNEVFDSKRINLYCAPHSYFGPVKDNPNVHPTMGCANCWKIYLIHSVAEIPPSKREEMFSHLEESLRKCMELEDEGKFDFEPYLHPEITIEKE